MKIFAPQELSRCDNRNQKAKTNKQTGEPAQWFTAEHLQPLGYNAFSFDFFINWRQHNFVKVLWFKRFIDISVNELITDCDWQNKVISLLIQTEGKAHLADIQNFCDSQNLHADFLIFNEEQWSDNEAIIYARLHKTGFDIKVIGLDALKNKIKIGTGRSFHIGAKGLIYSTSRLECALSMTDTPYPGDADMVLANDDYSQFIIIEFKKHNLPTPLSEQRLSRYYPHKDRSKYERLALLRQRLPNARLYTLYYTTDGRHETKLELNAYAQVALGEWNTRNLAAPSNIYHKNEVAAYISDCVDFFRKALE